MQIPDTIVYQMSRHIWLLNPYIDFWATMYSFFLAYFCSFNFQLSTNNVVAVAVVVVVVVIVVVVLLPLVQK